MGPPRRNALDEGARLGRHRRRRRRGGPGPRGKSPRKAALRKLSVFQRVSLNGVLSDLRERSDGLENALLGGPGGGIETCARFGQLHTKFVKTYAAYLGSCAPDFWLLFHREGVLNLLCSHTRNSTGRVQPHDATQVARGALDTVVRFVQAFAERTRRAFESLSRQGCPSPYLLEFVSEVFSFAESVRGPDWPPKAYPILSDLAVDLARADIGALGAQLKDFTAHVVAAHTKGAGRAAAADGDALRSGPLPRELYAVYHEATRHVARVIEEGGPGLAFLPELLLPKLLEALDACFGLVVGALREDVRRATFSSETAQAVLLMMRDAVALRTEEVPRLRALWLRLFGGSDRCETWARRATESLAGLQRSLVSEYVQCKFVAIDPVIDGVLCAEDPGFWLHTPKPRGVRREFLQLLHALVEVHAEVQAAAPFCGQEVMLQIVDMSWATLRSLFARSQVQFCPNGRIQLALEICYFESCVAPCMTPESRERSREMQQQLNAKVSALPKMVDRELGRTRLARLCFAAPAEGAALR